MIPTFSYIQVYRGRRWNLQVNNYIKLLISSIYL
jgi:hypothetical protein